MKTIKFFILCFVFYGFSYSPILYGALTSTDNIDLEIYQYIHQTWDALTRSNKKLEQILPDPKFKLKPGEKYILYISRQENLPQIKKELQQELSKKLFAQINIMVLPEKFVDIKQHGLLYLPYPYIVPGGRFNEFYGWDSYFIILGLLRDQKIQLAKNIVDNMTYEIKHYGTILNANRTYQLERSQPPLYTQMILAVYQVTQDKAWLQATLPTILKFYHYWTTPPHLIPELGLSRYYALGDQPAPEVLSDENYYSQVQQYFTQQQKHYYDVSQYFDINRGELTPAFYKGDQTIRESGFDLTARFGPFGTQIVNFIPVDLNVLLYQMERDTATIYHILRMPEENVWLKRAEKRQQLINDYLWNDTLGYYFDYNFVTRQQYPYIFATTFYPLWAGIASSQQAKRLVENLPNLETPRGIITSPYVTGNQWDAPFGWAPLQYFAVKGLARYGYCTEAKRIAANFLHTINEVFAHEHAIFEKYNLHPNAPAAQVNITLGYTVNQAGFGWTNGVYLEFAYFLQHPETWCTTVALLN